MAGLPDLTGRTILQVVPELSAGGVERTVLEVSEAVVEAGGRALVASRGGRLEGELDRLGGELFVLDVKSKNPVTLWRNVARLATIIEQEKVDLVHARSRAPAWSALGAARRTRRPFVTTYHGAYSGRSPLKKRYNAVMARGDRVIANSAWIAEHVRAVHGVGDNRLVTIPRGVDLNAFDPQAVAPRRVEALRHQWGLDERADALALLLPGRLTAWKGQKIAIEAVARLAEASRERLVLVLAGDAQGRDNYYNELLGAIEAAGLNGRVKLPGHCGDMPAAYLAADLVLVPSTRPEAFGRTAAEAGAMGRIVITTDHGGGRETIRHGETGLRVKPGDPDALSEAIGWVLSRSGDQRAAMEEAAADFIRARYSKRGLQKAVLGVYADLLSA